eukprot:1626002-Prymnesium_polylepis.1
MGVSGGHMASAARRARPPRRPSTMCLTARRRSTRAGGSGCRCAHATAAHTTGRSAVACCTCSLNAAVVRCCRALLSCAAV